MATESARVTRQLRRFIEKVVVKITLDIVANLQEKPSKGGTPIDTGWARANWIATATVPSTSPVGTRHSVSAGASSRAIAKLISTYRLAAGPIYVSNSVPYIARLNQGSSKQAPAGFVQRAIARAIRSAARGV